MKDIRTYGKTIPGISTPVEDSNQVIVVTATNYDYSALWKQPLFKYAAVINYNYSTNKVLNKGSGIFLHIAPKNGGFTLGCVGIEEDHLIKLLKWLDPSKNPVILMGVSGHI
jgi:L,D-peptidoglycan transpeptidase YkuD (ErfK/YbiS/YcfS/YnhG family)